jgi:hypothetical protein
MAEINLVAHRQLRGFIALSNPIAHGPPRSNPITIGWQRSNPVAHRQLRGFIASSNPVAQIKSSHLWMAEIKSSCPQIARSLMNFIARQ